MTRSTQIFGRTVLWLILSSPTIVFWYSAISDDDTLLGGDKLLVVTGVISPLLFVTSIVLAIIKPKNPEFLIAAAVNSTPLFALLVIILFGFVL